MFSRDGFNFPKIDKAFFKGIFWLLVFVFLASVFSSAGGIYDRLIQRPEVRKVTLYSDRNASEIDALWLQRVVVIHNRGNADAKNLHIFCTFPKGVIHRITILTEENYTFNDDDSGSSCGFSLPRLSAGAKFVAILYASVANTDQLPSELEKLPVVSATFDGGSAIESKESTTFEEMQELSTTLIGGTSEIITQLDLRLEASTAVEDLFNNHLPKWGINYHGAMGTNSKDFRKALLTAIFLSVTAWLLLRKIWAGLTIAAIFSLLVWLYVDIRIDSSWMIVPIVVAIMAIFTTARSRTIIFRDDTDKRRRGRLVTRGRIFEISILVVLLAVMIIGLYRNTSPSDWSCLISNGIKPDAIFTCYDDSVHAATWAGCVIFATYLLLVDL